MKKEWFSKHDDIDFVRNVWMGKDELYISSALDCADGSRVEEAKTLEGRQLILDEYVENKLMGIFDDAGMTGDEFMVKYWNGWENLGEAMRKGDATGYAQKEEEEAMKQAEKERIEMAMTKASENEFDCQVIAARKLVKKLDNNMAKFLDIMSNGMIMESVIDCAGVFGICKAEDLQFDKMSLYLTRKGIIQVEANLLCRQHEIPMDGTWVNFKKSTPSYKAKCLRNYRTQRCSYVDKVYETKNAWIVVRMDRRPKQDTRYDLDCYDKERQTPESIRFFEEAFDWSHNQDITCNWIAWTSLSPESRKQTVDKCRSQREKIFSTHPRRIAQEVK